MRGARDHLPAPGGDGVAETRRASRGDPVAGGDGVAELYTVGHSTRSLDELVALLEAAGVRRLVDIRLVPRSRRHPHFSADALSQSLPERGIGYRHERALGGFRRPRPGSPNTGWQEPMFQGYADYMSTPEFAAGLDRLQAWAREEPTAMMCAEAQWWRCHRRLVADALLVGGWRVLHLGIRRDPVEHTLTQFAVQGPGGTVTYPPPAS